MPSPALTPLAAAALRVGRSPERVLALERGEGEPALFLAREFPAARVRGVDDSEARVRAARAKVGLDPEGRIAFKVGRPGSLPFPEDFFDLVAQLDGRAATAELARVLSPGGYLIFARSARRRSPLGRGALPSARALARHGIELLESAEAGEGSFCVARLRGGDGSPGAL